MQAGTVLNAVLVGSLSTQTAKPGSTFIASVVDPLYAPDGTVIVPAGSRIKGTVVEVRKGPARLTLTLDWIQTVRGPASIEARIDHTEAQGYLAGQPIYWAYGDLGYPGMSTLTPSSPAIEFGQNAYGYTEPSVAGEVRLPSRSVLRMVLTRPIVPPSSRTRAMP